jgi:hypothetical protein
MLSSDGLKICKGRRAGNNDHVGRHIMIKKRNGLGTRASTAPSLDPARISLSGKVALPLCKPAIPRSSMQWSKVPAMKSLAEIRPTSLKMG